MILSARLKHRDSFGRLGTIASLLRQACDEPGHVSVQNAVYNRYFHVERRSCLSLNFAKCGFWRFPMLALAMPGAEADAAQNLNETVLFPVGDCGFGWKINAIRG